MDYGEVLKFSFAWLSNREALKYALIIWTVTLLLNLALFGAFFIFFGGIISSFLANPIGFISEIALSPNILLTQLLPAILAFVVFAGILAIVGYFVNMYISVLLNFYGFRSANLSYPPFPPRRLFKLIVLYVASTFLVLFSWIHRMAWVLPILLVLGGIFAILGLLSPIFSIIGFLLLLVAAAALVVFPLYLFFAKDSNAIVTHRYFLLFAPLVLVLLLLSILLPLLLILVLLLFFVYLAIILYNMVKVWFSTTIFLNKGTSVFSSLKGSIDLVAGNTLEVFFALLIGGVAGLIIFGIVGAIGGALLQFIFSFVVPADLWGLADFMRLLALTPQLDSFALQSQVVGILAQEVWNFIVTPFAMLFGVFLTIGIYLNLISPEEKAK